LYHFWDLFACNVMFDSKQETYTDQTTSGSTKTH
jgi:hypothetical protein